MAYSKWQGTILVVFINILMNTFILYSNTQLAFTLEFTKTFFIVVYITMAIAYLLFPFFGWLGDRYFTRYKVTLFGMTCTLTATVAGIGTSILNYYYLDHVQNTKYFWAILFIITTILIAGMGLIYTNILQLGLNQLLNHSASLLLGLVRSYYWSLHIGPLLMHYILCALFICDVFHNRLYHNRMYHQTGGGALFISLCVQLVFMCITFIGFCIAKRCLNIVPAGQNPLLMIIKVCLYACTYKVSKASTESSVLIDAGKPNHGGPFKDAEIEEVKNFFKALSILMSLLALQVTGDTFSLGEHLIAKTSSCPSLVALVTVGINPNHIPHLLIIIGVPVYQLVLRCATRQYIKVSTHKKIVTGLVCSITAIATRLLIMYFIQSANDSPITDDNYNYTSLTRYCFALRMHQNDTESLLDPDDTNHAYWLLLLPQLLIGLGYILVAMTTLEYICSQASSEVQGILIGMWYSTNTLKLIIEINDVYNIRNLRWWYIIQSSQLAACVIFSLSFIGMAFRSTYKDLEETIEQPPTTRRVTCRVATVTRGRRWRRNRGQYGAI